MDEIVKVIKYAVYGYEFQSEEEAQSFKTFREKVIKASTLIAQQPDGNAEEGLDNTPEAVKRFEEAFVAIIAEFAPTIHEYYKATGLRGYIGRALSDGSSPYAKVLTRLYYDCVMCVGADNKTYGQPYFANQTFKK